MKNNIIISIFILFMACSKSETPKNMRPPATVQVAHPSVEDVAVTLETFGNIYPFQSVDIRAQVQGKLLITHVTNGQMVKEGDLLFTIDPRPFEAALDKAQATLIKDVAASKYAKQRLERYSKLTEKNYVSQQSIEDYQNTFDVAEGQIEIDKADIEAAQVNVDYSFIRSPLNGRLGNLPIDPGNIVSPSDVRALTQVEQLTPAKVNFTISQDQFFPVRQSIASNQIKVQIYHPGMNDKMTGEIDFIDNQIDLSTGTLLIKANIPNEKTEFWPGEFVRVILTLKVEPNTLVLPSDAVLQGQKGMFVYVVKPDMTTEVRDVTVVQHMDSKIAIKGDLKPEDQVVVQGQLNIYPGIKVMIMNKTDQETKS